MARKRGGFPRALRCAVTIDPELVESTRGGRSRLEAGEPGPSVFQSKGWRSWLEAGEPGPSILLVSR
jgi:hypothetical protein